MTYSNFKKPDSYKNVNTSTYKEIKNNTSYLTKIISIFDIKNYKFYYQNL
jgi:hypothetical protein